MVKNKFRIFGKKLWRIISPIFFYTSPSLGSKILYILSTRKYLNLKNPKDFNEKLMWLKLNWQSPLIIKCADKYEVREYLTAHGYSNLLPKLYGVYSESKDIDWDELPEKFVIKCNHGCGCNIICDDKKKLNKNEASIKLDEWLKTRFAFEVLELHYDKITPRIICEEYIETNDGFLPNDYKIYCFNGEPKIILICTERDIDLKLKFMDIEWNELNIGESTFINNDFPRKPKWFNDMITIARDLSRPFPFVRIDFYDRDDKPFFGEMTFTPAGCAARYYNEVGLKMLGDMLILPEQH